MKVQGKIISGLGNAEFWMEKISKIFEEKYNFKPFLGTLNVLLEREIILDDKEKIMASEYGGDYDVLVLKCTILGKEAYIVRTTKNNSIDGDHKPNVIEIVADEKLREKFNLKDGNTVCINI